MIKFAAFITFFGSVIVAQIAASGATDTAIRFVVNGLPF